MPETLLEEVKRYVGFGPADEDAIRSVGSLLEPSIESVASDFYDHILQHSGARGAITGGSHQVERLKRSLIDWMEGFLKGPWDSAYYELRARIGRRHVLIRLPQEYMFTAMNVIRGHFIGSVLAAMARGDSRTTVGTVHALNKLFDIELAIMLHTYREDMLAQIARQERLATYGQLVGSIAHEIRNPLSVIQSSLYLLRRESAGNERVAPHVEEIQNQVHYAGQIISALLEMIAEHPPVREPTAAQEVIELALEARKPTPGVQIIRDFATSLPSISVDRDQLRQVLLNIVGNALDAVGEGGVIRVSARVEQAQLELSIEDDGPGIEPTIAARLFEPLVTGKPSGIGLGLALCKKLVEQNGGTIGFDRQRTRGALFYLRFPIGAS